MYINLSLYIYIYIYCTNGISLVCLWFTFCQNYNLEPIWPRPYCSSDALTLYAHFDMYACDDRYTADPE